MCTLRGKLHGIFRTYWQIYILVCVYFIGRSRQQECSNKFIRSFVIIFSCSLVLIWSRSNRGKGGRETKIRGNGGKVIVILNHRSLWKKTTRCPFGRSSNKSFFLHPRGGTFLSVLCFGCKSARFRESY